MRIQKRTVISLLAFATGAALFGTVIGLTGCESDRTKSVRKARIDVSPHHATVRHGESVDLVASGWDEYSWTLKHDAYGALSHRTGDRVRYTRIGGTNVVQVVTVNARISGTNANRISAQATIVHP